MRQESSSNKEEGVRGPPDELNKSGKAIKPEKRGKNPQTSHNGGIRTQSPPSGWPQRSGDETFVFHMEKKTSVIWNFDLLRDRNPGGNWKMRTGAYQVVPVWPGLMSRLDSGQWRVINTTRRVCLGCCILTSDQSLLELLRQGRMNESLQSCLDNDSEWEDGTRMEWRHREEWGITNRLKGRNKEYMKKRQIPKTQTRKHKVEKRGRCECWFMTREGWEMKQLGWTPLFLFSSSFF